MEKDLRPISLTDCLSKVVEDCTIHDYRKPAVLKVLDPSQYGMVPHSSTTQAPRQMEIALQSGLFYSIIEKHLI